MGAYFSYGTKKYYEVGLQFVDIDYCFASLFLRPIEWYGRKDRGKGGAH